VLESPFSRYTEAIKAVKIAADLNGALNPQRVIGLTSSLSGEGKSTIASNLAHLIADARGAAILVDADLRGSSLTQRLAPDSLGLVEVISANLPLDAAITLLPFSKLHFLGTGRATKLRHTNEILASAAMKNLVDTLRARYDHIIVDLSPVGPIVDVRTTGHFIDSYIYVIEWGKTKAGVIQRSLTEANCVHDRLLGAVLNKVDLRSLDLYEKYPRKYSY
jgi:polysaccharide biosynthesis transport protein